MIQSQQIVLSLIRSVVTGENPRLPDKVDWGKVMELALAHGVVGLCMDAVERLGTDHKPEIPILMKWIGQVHYMEGLYAKQREVVSSLAEFYSAHGIPMMLLKGLGLSLFWPKPERRPVGDLDIYLFGRWREADDLIINELGIKVDNSHHHHSVFTFQGVMVENHYDFLNVHSHPSNRPIEVLFKKMAEKCTANQDELIENVSLPSVMLNALYVSRHAACHFAAEKINLRQVLDVAFMLKAIGNLMDWDEFAENMRRFGMLDFMLALKDLCVRYLGFDEGFLPLSESIPEDVTVRMLDDILEPEDTGSGKKGIKYIAHRLKLWWRNRWKHKMVYSDNLFCTFVFQMKSHLLRPRTIFGN